MHNEIAIENILIGRRRPLGDITELAASINEIGLLNPITVTKDFKLVAGHHRIKAFEYLGIRRIPIRIIDCSYLQAQLAEIDENLLRNNGTEFEQCQALAKRKAIYLELYPETANGAKGGWHNNKMPNLENDIMSFSSDSALKTGKSKRTTERKTAIGEKLGSMGDAIKAAGLADRQADLTDLVRLQSKSPEKVPEVLSLIAAGCTSVKLALRQISLTEQKVVIDRGNIKMPTGLFDVISIDPPWMYEQGESCSYDAEGRRVSSPYPEMNINQIKALKLPAKDACVIWLWTTQKFLHESFGVLDAWGFDYKATMVWDKEQMGMGYWLRMQCEFCLLAVKGSPVWDNTRIRDIFREKRREHSRKPEAFYRIVDEICVGRKLDYFSRETRPGWSNFGNDSYRFNC